MNLSPTISSKTVRLLCVATLGAVLIPAAFAQQPGPLPAPGPLPGPAPKRNPTPPPAASQDNSYHMPTAPQKLHSPGDNPITNEPPSQPVEDIIKRFAEREAE